LEKNINEQKDKNDKLLSDVKDKNILEESNKNYEKLLNEKNSQIEKLNKDYENTQKNLEEQKKLNDELNLNKEKDILDKDKKLKEFQEQELDKKLISSNISNEEFKRKNDDLSQNIKDKEEEIQKLKDEEEEQEKKNEDLLKKCNLLNSDNLNLKEEIEAERKKNDEPNEIQKQKEKEYEKKIKEFEDKEKNADSINNRREKELDERESELINKEKEFNKKIGLLKDKENLIENENNEMKIEKEQFQKYKEENEKIQKKIINLVKKKVDLEKEINTKNNILTQMNKLLNNKINNNLNIPMNNNFNNNLSSNNLNNLILPKEPTLVGLNNIGAKCFMNSTLQCLSQTKVLSEYFLNEKNKDRIINNNLVLEKKSDTQLSPAFLDLITQLWKKDGPKSLSPYNFVSTVKKMNPLFKKGQAGDAKVLVIFILEQLHKELKKKNNYQNNSQNIPLNQYDKIKSLNDFMNDFGKEGSVISDHFFGFNETATECLYCKNNFNSQGQINPIYYNYEIFNCLIFPLEKVKSMKNNYYQTFNNNMVTIYECFIYNQKKDMLNGNITNYCNICKQLGDSNYCSRIFVSPNVLILILNRGKDNMYNVKLNFTERIDLTQYVLQRDKPLLLYDLYGVISHIEDRGPNSHFVASCKSPVNNKWYRYNDAFVNPIENLQKEVIDFETPYILFYQKV